jgi:hypothetical protein
MDPQDRRLPLLETGTCVTCPVTSEVTAALTWRAPSGHSNPHRCDRSSSRAAAAFRATSSSAPSGKVRTQPQRLHDTRTSATTRRAISLPRPSWTISRSCSMQPASAPNELPWITARQPRVRSTRNSPGTTPKRSENSGPTRFSRKNDNRRGKDAWHANHGATLTVPGKALRRETSNTCLSIPVYQYLSINTCLSIPIITNQHHSITIVKCRGRRKNIQGNPQSEIASR